MGLTTMGIDQSLTSTGVVVLQDGQLIHTETFPTSSSEELMDRVLHIAESIASVIMQFKPAVVAIEEPIHVKNPKITIKLSILFGVIVAYINKIEFKGVMQKYKPVLHIVNPTELKSFATGSGKASKGDMGDAIPDEVQEVWEGKFKKKDDIQDAYHLAVFAMKQ